jgi:hypothetical protein
MEPYEGKPLSGPEENSDLKTFATKGSHDVTLDSTQVDMLKNPKELNEVLSNEYYLTAQVSNSSLSLRQLSLLLEVLCYQIANFGSNFSMYLALSELYFRVKGNAKTSEEISDAKIRLVVSISEILLGALGGQDFSLYSGEFIFVRSEIREILKNYLMSKRTYGSRYKTWRPEKLIRIKAVPVETLINRPPFRTERYSGYTKGYGESHESARTKRTKPSEELDGSDRPDKEERNLLLRMTDQEHQKSNSLWIKVRNLLRRD